MGSEGLRKGDPVPPGVVDSLRARARTEGHRRAYTFLDDGEAVGATCTYEELVAKVSALAAGLIREDLRGRRVLLALPPGLELTSAFLACLMAGVAAVPLPAAAGGRGRNRFRSVAEDCEAAALWGSESSAVPGFKTLFTPELSSAPGEPGSGRNLPLPHPGDVAFLQYTSGSTGRPKGAVITHRALAANLEMIRTAFRLTSEDVVGSWLPPFHDMGLVGGLLAPLTAGAPAILMPPLAFLSKPRRWLGMIDRFRVTVSGGPDFAYRLCLDRIPESRRRELDLSSWEVAFCGAEPVRPGTLSAFSEGFVGAGFRSRAFVPCYGLAEATLLVSAGRRGEDAGTLAGAGRRPPAISCGPPAPRVELRTLHPETGEPSAPGEEGEIWVSSPALAEGYWNPQPDGEEAFPARPPEALAGGSWLRTGDLGILREGNLYVTGRLKDLIVLRGRNIHPEDLEALALAAHPALAGARGAAFGVPAGDDAVEGERVILALAPARTKRRSAAHRGDEIRRSIRRAIRSGLDLDVEEILLLRPASLPLTSSGKVRRRRTRELYLEGSLRELEEPPSGSPPASPSGSPPSELEDVRSWLASFLAQRRGESPPALEGERSLADFGLDSMGLTRLQHGLEQAFGARVPLAELLEGPSLGDLVRRVEGERSEPAAAEVAAEEGPEEGEWRMSEGQEALYFLHQARPESTAYHLASALWIDASVKTEALDAALRRLILRHDALRTVFAVPDGETAPRPRWTEREAAYDLVAEDARASRDADLEARLRRAVRRPFDLERGPLLRLHLFRREGADLLLMNLHHVAGDLWSVALLWHQLSEILAGGGAEAEPAPARPAFYPWVARRRRWLASSEGRAAAAYWRDTLEPPPAPAWISPDRRPDQRPGDRPDAHPPVAAGALRVRPGKGWQAAIEALARRRRGTPYMVLMAVFQALLFRYEGSRRFSLGTLDAGREEAETTGVVGYFVNPVVVVADVPAGESFLGLLERVRERAVEALAHRGVPFPRLARELAPPRPGGAPALFSILLSWQGTAALEEPSPSPVPGGIVLGFGGSETVFAGAPARSCPLPPRDPPFDLSLLAAAEGEELLWRWEYRRDRYDETTVRRLARHLEALLEGALADPSGKIERLSLLSAGEKHQVVVEPADTARPAPDGTLLGRILHQASRRPAAEALRQGAQRLSFGELAKESFALAGALAERGVGRESLVVLALPRSPEWVVGALATLLAGGAFLPIDPEEPAPRLAAMVEDSAPDLLLSLGPPPGAAAGVPSLDLLSRPPAKPLPTPLGEAPEQLAYVLFTSGSTGRPKGAMNTRRGLFNRLRWMQRAYPLGSRDRVLQKTPLTFDVSLWEVFWPLMTGALLVLAPPGAHRDPRLLLRRIAADGVTVVHFVPSLLGPFLGEVERAGRSSISSLRRVVASGEALDGELAAKLHRVLGPEVRFENLYGPTEAAIDVTAFPVLRGTGTAGPAPGPVPLGRAVDNTRVHVLDRGLEPAPLGVPGELFLGGVQLARGYLGDPRKTAESFLPDPVAGPGEEGGGRLYRTGDLGLRRPDGSLVFLRRLDGQVKVRGIRIELGEVEAVLTSHRGVGEGAAALIDDAPEDRTPQARPRLVAYYVESSPGEVDPRELREFLRRRLPPAMEPQILVPLAELPRTASGKLDRSRLPRPAAGRRPAEVPFRPARTAAERALTGALEAGLQVPRVGLDDDFFALGGDSISSLRVRTALHRQGWDLSLDAFLEERAVERMAEVMTPLPATEETEPEPAFSRVAAADLPRLPPGLEDAYPLSRTQSGVIFHCQFDGSSVMYRDLFLVRFEGPLVANLLEGALRPVVKRHPMLRTTFDLESFSEPLQLVWEEAAVRLRVADLASSIEEWIRGELALPLKWSEAPVPRFYALRAGTDGFWLVISFFDALFDGWSAASLAREIVAAYDARLAGRDPSRDPAPSLEPPEAGFRRFLAAELEALADEGQRELWRRRLDDAPSGELLPKPTADGDEVSPATAAVRVVEEEIPESLEAALEALTGRCGTGLKQALLAAHLAALSAFCGRRSLTTGLEVHCRPEIPGADRILGMHMNILPFPATLDGGSFDGGSWEDLLRTVAAREKEWLRYRRFPFAEMARGRPGGPLLETVFNYTHFHVLSELASLERLRVRQAFAFNQTSFPLRADFHRHPVTGRLRLALTVREEVLGRARHQRLAAAYRRALEDLAARPRGETRELSVLGPGEEQQILREWGRGRPPGARPHLPGEVFRQIARYPERAALEESGGASLTYRELGRRVGELARRLEVSGCGPGTVTAIFAGRSSAYVTAALAVLTAGGTFLPLSLREPELRLGDLVRQAGARRILVEAGRRLPEALRSLEIPIAPSSPPAAASPPSNLEPPNLQSQSLAYLIFTSGSTGVPKAVAVSHGALAGFFAAMEETLGRAAGERWLALTEPTFDISLLELFFPLRCGGTSVIAPEGAGREPAELLRRAEDPRLDALQATPAVWQTLADAGWRGRPGLKVLSGGESLPAELARRLRAGGGEVWNLYGPTEATVWATAHPLKAAQPRQGDPAVTLGRPLPGVAAYVLDSTGRPLGEGVSGELYLAGGSLARGYWGKPAATAESFLPDPFAELPGRRLYRTGDRCRWTPQGRLEFLGRRDGQLKIRGVRVEPGEIEAVLGEAPGVRRAVVRAGETAPEHRGLLAYVEPRQGAAPTAEELRRFLERRLPSSLIPAHFFVVASWPLTRHGKLDARRLPLPRWSRPPAEVLGSLVDLLEGMTEDEARALTGSGELTADDLDGEMK